MRLFLAEKPSLGRAIANGLGSKKKAEGCIYCGDNVVTWCFGHMLSDAMPEDYDEAYSRWKREHLPIIPAEWKSCVRKDASAQLKIIGALLKKADSVVNAGDPDREGQLLIDEVLEYFKYRGNVERIWLASLDDRSVKTALGNIGSNKDYAPLRDAARARARADWLVGINATRALTIKGRESGRNYILSLGRVQTPTLALVVARDLAIANFRPIDFFSLKALFTNEVNEFSADFVPADTQEGLDASGRLVDENIAKSLIDKIQGKNGTIISSTRENKSKAAPLPHCLSSLQKVASAKLGMSAQEVLDTAQKLYEKKLATYPRTDCRYLPEEQLPAASGILLTLSTVPGLEFLAKNADVNQKSKAWNTGKITAHHAIIPTGEKPEGLMPRERELFLLIASAYCLQFYPPMRFEAQKISVDIDGFRWDAAGRRILEPGWTVAGQDDEAESDEETAQQELPSMDKGQNVICREIACRKKKTTPPSRFTEGTLIEAMASVHRFVDDASARATLKDAKGIGTEATRAKIIETLKERKYIATEKKALISTPLGKEVIELAPDSLKDPITTAIWEARLETIANGEEELSSFLESQCHLLPELLAPILNREIKADHICPQCGAALCRRKSKKGDFWFWGCTAYPDCKVILSDDNGEPGKPRSKPVLSNKLCPDCGKPLVRRKGKNGDFYGCSGYPQCTRTFRVIADEVPDIGDVILRHDIAGAETGCARRKSTQKAPTSGKEQSKTQRKVKK